MYDPLNEGFGSGDLSPGWPTTPHQPGAAIPNMPRPSRPTTPRPLTPRTDSPPRTPSIASDLRGPLSPLGREPQVYGQLEPGLVSPQVTTGTNGERYEKPGEYLRMRITGLDRNRRDILIRFDAQTNLSNFTGPTYRNVQRSYLEFQQLAEALAHSCPQTITPALPFAQTSAPTDEEDDRLVKIMLQRWVQRVCEDPILLHDEELRAFVESDFGYQPTPRPRRKTGSGFTLIRRGVPDEDEELQKARFELTKLEGQFFEAAKAVDKLTKARKALATTHAEMGNKLINVATTEAHPNIGNAMRKLGRTWHSVADLDQAQAISECVILGDSLGYQGMNARAAKETLQQRTSVLEEYQQAVKTTISKRRNIERLKASSNIRPEKVDEALEEMEEANKYEQILQRRADGISQNLHRSMATHRRLVEEDVTTALIEHVRSSLMYEKQLLRELEALRPDIDNAASNAPVAVKAVAPLRPAVVPPLDEPSRPAPSSRAAPPAPLSGSFNAPRPALPNPLVAAQAPLPPTPVSARPSAPSAPLSPQSPTAALSAPTSPAKGPPLGGRFVDGTQSMFVSRPSGATPPVRAGTLPPLSPASPMLPDPSKGISALPPAPQRAFDPLAVRIDPLRTPGPASATQPPSPATSGLDPLGGMRPGTLSQSMSASARLSHQRSRLDAREAASKLANAF